jgi:glycoprotein endo-alpha-1,2-mannosidase
MGAFCKAKGKIWSPSIGPGYVDTKIGGSLDHPRDNGSLYEKNWEWAIGSNPEWISITSFNEWHEGSQIEPASFAPPARSSFNYYTYQGAYGLTGEAGKKAYITKTAEWIDKWK